MRTSLIIAALALALGSCSDDSKQKLDKSTSYDAKLDQPVAQHDTATTHDTGPAKEGLSMPDGITLDTGSNPYSCIQISYCAKPCGTDFNCVTTKCSDRGCQSAKDAFAALSSCSIQKCLPTGACLGGFDDACAACALKNCPTEYGACAANKC